MGEVWGKLKGKRVSGNGRSAIYRIVCRHTFVIFG